MGVLAEISGPIGNFTATPVTIAAGFAAFLVLAVVLNVLQQLLLKNPNEPPVVFHLFPVIGSTITYGMDPYKFFFAQQKKVCRVPNGHEGIALTGGSMATCSPSSCSVAR
jgi:sterol 14-demethylase